MHIFLNFNLKMAKYLENNCVDDPVKLCDFQLLENRIMKTIHSV